MTDLIFFGLALAAFITAVAALANAWRGRHTQFGPRIHFLDTSELIYIAAPDIRDDVVREALLDRAAQLQAVGD